MVERKMWGLAIGVLMMGACGGGSDGGADANGSDRDPAEVVGETVSDASDAEDLTESVDDLAEDLESVQDAIGGGGATLTANGQTWEFPSVLCAFGEDQIGQPGAVFNLSAIGDGLQLYASIDDSGGSHSLSLNDIKNFEDPSVSLSVNGFVASIVGASEDFLVLDGKQLTADVAMMDGTTDQPIAGTAQLTATCP